MPILDVEIVVANGEVVKSGLAGELADVVGDILRTEPGKTWGAFKNFAARCYAENGGGPPDGVLPVFVTVLKAQRPTGDALRDEVRQLTNHIAQICGRPPENVHVLYLPDAAGRIAFGGTVRET